MTSRRRSLTGPLRAFHRLESFPALAATLGILTSLLAIQAVPTVILAVAVAIVAIVPSFAVYARSRGVLDSPQQAMESTQMRGSWSLPQPTAEEIFAQRLPFDHPLWPTYLSRGVDDEIADAVRESTFVLVTGAAGSGKTAALLHAACAVYPDHRVLAPAERAEALAELIATGPPSDSGPLPMLLFLDELERFAGHRADLTALADVLSAPQRFPRWFVVLATAREPLPDQSGDSSFAALLEHARIVRIPAATVSAKVADFGIRGSDPGQLLAHVAADWARTGVGKPIAEDDLLRLAGAYSGIGEVGSSRLAAELPSIVGRGLLEASGRGEAGESGYLPTSSVVEARLSTEEPVPRAVWSAALAGTDPGQALSVASAARVAGEQAVEEEALLVAVESGDPAVAAEASLRLAVLAQRASDYERAGELLQPALVAEDESTRRNAALVYASIATQTGRMDDARRVLTRLLDLAPDAEAMSSAAVVLADVYEQLEDPRAAEAVLRKVAMESEDPTALYRLGELVFRHGETGTARDAWERAARQGHIKAMQALGAFEASSGRDKEAELWLREAAHMGSASAALSLGTLLADQRPDEAELWLDRAIERADPESAAAAALLLARVTQARGNSKKALAAFQRALDLTAQTPAHAGEGEGSGSGVRAAESRVLHALSGATSLDEAQIASAALLSPNVVTDVLHRLVREGSIEALSGPSGRARYVLASSIPTSADRR